MDFSSKTQILLYRNLICHGFGGEYNWNNNLKITKASRKNYQAIWIFKHEDALLAITKEIHKLWENPQWSECFPSYVQTFDTQFLPVHLYKMQHKPRKTPLLELIVNALLTER